MGKATRRKTSHIAGLFEIFFVFIILFSLSPANGQTTGSILGYVFESGTTTPISGVSVQAYSSSTGAGDHTAVGITAMAAAFADPLVAVLLQKRIGAVNYGACECGNGSAGNCFVGALRRSRKSKFFRSLDSLVLL